MTKHRIFALFEAIKQLKTLLVICKKNKTKAGLTLDGRREGWFGFEEGAQSCTHSWVEVLVATLLSPQRAARLQQSQTQWNLCHTACYLQLSWGGLGFSTVICLFLDEQSLHCFLFSINPSMYVGGN